MIDFAQQFFLVFDPLLFAFVAGYFALRNFGILAVDGVRKNTSQGIIVLLRNGIVLMVVAPCATGGEAKKAACHHIHAVMPLIGACHLYSAVVIKP